MIDVDTSGKGLRFDIPMSAHGFDTAENIAQMVAAGLIM
jgi:hypothetical protein